MRIVNASHEPKPPFTGPYTAERWAWDRANDGHFNRNRLAGVLPWLQRGEVVPHFFSQGSYALTRLRSTRTGADDELIGFSNSCLSCGCKLVHERRSLAELGPYIAGNLRCPNDGHLHSTCQSSSSTFDAKWCLPPVHLTDLSGFFFETSSIPKLVKFQHLLPDLSRMELYADSISFHHASWRVMLDLCLGAPNPYSHRGLGFFLSKDEFTMDQDDHCFTQQWITTSKEHPEFYSADRGWGRFHESCVREYSSLLTLTTTHLLGRNQLVIFPGLILESFLGALALRQLVPVKQPSGATILAQYLQVYFDDDASQEHRDAFVDAYAEVMQQQATLADLVTEGRKGQERLGLAPAWHHPLHSALNRWLSEDIT